MARNELTLGSFSQRRKPRLLLRQPIWHMRKILPIRREMVANHPRMCRNGRFAVAWNMDRYLGVLAVVIVIILGVLVGRVIEAIAVAAVYMAGWTYFRRLAV